LLSIQRARLEALVADVGASKETEATIEKIPKLVLYYSSPLSSATNGAAIRIDGGVVRSIL
jgi:enoyl-[acyl-carrier-protein] reductase (NADH)